MTSFRREKHFRKKEFAVNNLSPGSFKEYQLGLLGLFLMIGLVVSTLIAATTFFQIKRYPDEVVTVTGAASKLIESDSAEWRSNFSRRGSSMAGAYGDLKKDLATVTSYLKSAGVKADELTVSPVTTTTLYGRDDRGYTTNEIVGYELMQTVSVASRDVGKVDRISRESTELISKGIGFVSQEPSYHYTKLEDLKVEMLGAATRNAYERASSMANSTHRGIGHLRTAHMGVFQITAQNSTEVSDYGIHDTGSKTKKVTAVVNATFEMTH
jgi:uncharacterized protein